MSSENEKKANGLKRIARIHTDFTTKFGVPRQSGLINSLEGIIVFEPEYRNLEAVRGLEAYSHIWIIWECSKAIRDTWSPTVRPPRLGGNTRMGVFATRSPFRPNPIGLSSVRLERIEIDAERGPILYVLGADLMDDTPIYDIKPYLPYCDSHPDATGGFTDRVEERLLDVIFPEQWLSLIPEERREALKDVLAYDPRPAYQNDPNRSYGFEFSGFNICFQVQNNQIKVNEVTYLNNIIH